MSLLNQVLQDLDERTPPGDRQPLRMAVLATASRDAEEHEDAHGPDWMRLAVWLSVLVVVIAAIWALNTTDQGAAEVQAPTQSEATRAVAAVTPLGPEKSADPVAPMDSLMRHADTDTDTDPQAAMLPSPPVLQEPPKPDVVLLAEPVPSEITETDPLPASDQPGRSKQTTSVQTGEAAAPGFLPLRNTEMPAVERNATMAVRRKSSASVGVKTATRPPSQPLDRARRAIEQGELSTAEDLLQQRLQAAPADREARELLVGLMLRGERYDAAMRQLDEGLQQYPGQLKFVLIKARLLAQFGDVGDAVKFLESAPPARVDRIEWLQMLGALYQQQSRYELAADNYRALLGLTPSAGPAWVGLAISLDGLGDPAALAAYGRALQFGGLPAAAAAYAEQRISQLDSDSG